MQEQLAQLLLGLLDGHEQQLVAALERFVGLRHDHARSLPYPRLEFPLQISGSQYEPLAWRDIPGWANDDLLAAYSVELLLEFIDARCNRRALRFWGGGPRRFVEFLLSAHITGLACAMLLYANERLGPVIFASVVAI